MLRFVNKATITYFDLCQFGSCARSVVFLVHTSVCTRYYPHTRLCFETDSDKVVD